jgi:hypothetical protein
MNRPVRRLLAVVLAAVTWAIWPTAAQADMTKAQCIDANTNGQDFRRDWKLSAARQQFRMCATASCPAIVSDDCTKRLDELERAQPGIVFDVKDASGRDLSAVKVTVDGAPLADKVDGTALQVDPGEHVFVFTMPGQAPVTQTFVLKEGDKERRERIVLRPALVPAATSPSSGGAPSSSLREPGEGLGAQRMLGLVAGGVGVAGLAAGTVFGLLTISEGNKQQMDCASAVSCANPSRAASDHSTGATDRTISTVGFVAGGVLLAGGVVLFLTGGHPSEGLSAAGLVVQPSVGPDGGEMLLKGEF